MAGPSESDPGGRRSPAPFEPGYTRLVRGGDLSERARLAYRHLEDCDLCARYCHVNRRVTTRGAVCRTGERAIIHGYGPHHGEEDPLRGTRGSGTIFFSWCSLRCVFCQNWEISQKGIGQEADSGEIAGMMLELQRLGCHNINLVTPSHLVYNTGGYDSLEALALLDGIIDIYMPDMKYADADLARRYSHAPNYPEVNRAAVREMHRQVGDLVLDENGVAVRGLLVRHLVLPDGLAGTDAILRFLAHEISPRTYLNLMDQYHPCYRASEHPPLDRPITGREYRDALALAEKHGLRRLVRQRPTE